ncbi:MAG: DUF5695 domain-containing protein [Sphingomonas phyllosphaerae]|uniref:DUF5695 domain-containing protein n=1 Tax=Sphingomonas phyllosphaerae TaxID=257003 RepID=UPI002FF89FC7
MNVLMNGVGGAALTRRAILLSGGAMGAASLAAQPVTIASPTPRRISMAPAAAGSPFLLGATADGITSVRRRDDVHDTDYVRAGVALGAVRARVRRDATAWQEINTEGTGKPLGHDGIRMLAREDGIVIESRLLLDGDTLRWDISVRNEGNNGAEVGDLLLPMPMNTDFTAGQPLTASVLKHGFVSGHGSHVFWMRGNSAGPYLMLLPDTGTSLEYWDIDRRVPQRRGTWCAYIHAAATSAETAAAGTSWRQPVSALHLRPSEQRDYAFRFLWVDDYAAARGAITAAGLIDVEVTPGMTVPSDLHVDVALASSIPVERIEAEFPNETEVHRLPDRARRQLWRVRFARPGENRLTLHQPSGRRTHLEFFATEPVETMMKKRAAFIVRRQHRDPSKWYDGLFGEWNMATGTLLGPDNYDNIRGWRIYAVTCDDPGLSKPAYLATKNAEHPDPVEIAALDHYIDSFVWGGLQQTTEEAHPYGIYGILDWKRNRESTDPGPKGRLHIWRPYDYPHIFAMYLAMHRIARDHPGVPTRRSARDYLERAYGTALAMFTVPMRVTGWSAYNTGFYNECVIPEMVAALRVAGMAREAATLESHWARKVRAFVDPKADLFGSEYPFDSTGFESTQALARSALDAPSVMGVSTGSARAFADRQIAANLFCRGWLEPAYYYLGSDYRGTAGDAYTLTYMAQMGGGALLDHALNDIDDPHPLLRLGYASLLSAWALLNSGQASSGHGYWYPGEAHDGAAGGGFEPAPAGTTWLDQPHHRGSWYYSCEIDLGFAGAVRTAATIVADDPVFGLICHGGAVREGPDGLHVSVRDGVRRRLHVRRDSTSFDLILQDARFDAENAILVDAAGRWVSFAPQCFAPSATSVRLALRHSRERWKSHTIQIRDGRVVVDVYSA